MRATRGAIAAVILLTAGFASSASAGELELKSSADMAFKMDYADEGDLFVYKEKDETLTLDTSEYAKIVDELCWSLCGVECSDTLCTSEADCTCTKEVLTVATEVVAATEQSVEDDDNRRPIER